MHFSTFAAISRRLEPWADQHWPVLSAIGYTASFVMLLAGVALHAYESGLAHAAGVQCGPICLATPGFEYVAAATCGGVAILFVKLYAGLTAAVQRVFIAPFVYVRPGPRKQREVAGWAAVLYALIGIALFFAIALERTPGRFVSHLGGHAQLELFFGWWLGGRAVLAFFWSKARRELYVRSPR